MNRLYEEVLGGLDAEIRVYEEAVSSLDPDTPGGYLEARMRGRISGLQSARGILHRSMNHLGRIRALTNGSAPENGAQEGA